MPRRTTAPTLTSVELPVGIPESFEEHVTLMYELLAVAYQADLTRVATFMTDRELSARTYPQLGVNEQHHTVSHHGNDPKNIAQVAKINTYHSTLFGKFLEKMHATPDGDGSLLDHSLDLLRRRHGQSESARERSVAHGGRRRRRRKRTPAHPACAAHAGRQPVADRRAASTRARSSGSARATARSICSEGRPTMRASRR